MSNVATKRFIYKRDKQRHHQLMASESNPYRTVVRVVADDEKPPKRVEQPRDKSGLGKMAGVTTRCVRDQYRAIHDQQARLRKERLNAMDTCDNVDPVEFAEFLASIR